MPYHSSSCINIVCSSPDRIRDTEHAAMTCSASGIRRYPVCINSYATYKTRGPGHNALALGFCVDITATPLRQSRLGKSRCLCSAHLEPVNSCEDAQTRGPAGRGGAFAPYKRFRLGRKPWRRANSFRPHISITGGWSRPLGGGTQKERHASGVSFFLVEAGGVEPPSENASTRTSPGADGYLHSRTPA